jgi:hypothetical protein
MALNINGTTGLTFNNGSAQDVGGVGTSGQTWQNLTASRAAFTTYTNTTGKPISVQVSTVNGSPAVTSSTALLIDGVQVANPGEQANRRSWVGGIVPNGSTYFVSLSANGIDTWAELR